MNIQKLVSVVRAIPDFFNIFSFKRRWTRIQNMWRAWAFVSILIWVAFMCMFLFIFYEYPTKEIIYTLIFITSMLWMQSVGLEYCRIWGKK